MAKAPGVIRRRGHGWNVMIRVHGERHQYGPRTERFLGSNPSRNEVEEWTWRRYRELEQTAKREAAGLPGSVSFSALLKQFRDEELPHLSPGTQRSYKDSLGPIETYFVEELGDTTLDKVHAKHVKAFLSWRRVNRRRLGTAPLSNRTLSKDRAVLHRMFVLADRMEYRDGNPVARVPAPKCDEHNAVILDAEQYERLLTECSAHGPMLGLYVLVLGEAGARAYSEALRITWEDVDLEGGFLRIMSGREGHRTKSGRSRWIPMTPQLRQAMRDHFAAFRLVTYGGARSKWIFHHTTTRKPHFQGW